MAKTRVLIQLTIIHYLAELVVAMQSGIQCCPLQKTQLGKTPLGWVYCQL